MSEADEKKPEGKLKPLPAITKAQKKLCDTAAAIYQDSATPKEAAFMARQLVQVTLPHKNPGNVPFWARRNGNAFLGLQPGYNYKTGECYGYPYGTIPRLLLFWLITEAIRTKSPRLELGTSLHGFMAELGLNPSNGSSGAKRSDAHRLREQTRRLFNAKISFQGERKEGGRVGEALKNMDIADDSLLWWSEDAPEQGTLWGSWVQLGKNFYEAITAAPVPVDMRALRALKKSPLALDLYAWLVYEAYRAHKSGEARFETWQQLHGHLGGEYAHIQHFRAKVKAALIKIKVVYPGLKLGRKLGGIEILPESFPVLQPRNLTLDVHNPVSGASYQR
jgi:hypothetical protein